MKIESRTGEHVVQKKENLLENNIQQDKIDEILTSEEIKIYNQKMKNKSNAFYDLDKIMKLNAYEIKEFINQYQLPSLPKYNEYNEITVEDLSYIVKNKNLENVNDLDVIQKGIIVDKTNVKSFPTHMKFYSRMKSGFDSIQETELQVNTTVLILHESWDKEWYFIISSIYAGWVCKEDIADASQEDIDYFNHLKFGIILDAFMEVDDITLNMSVRLPYLRTRKNHYVFVLPIKGKDGCVSRKEIYIDKEKAHIGYLSYTKENVKTQALKYEGISYSWGGAGKGVDCSGYISNIYRTFGFELPRNTSDQEVCFEMITYLGLMTYSQKLLLLEGSEPSFLYQPGHVMLYLGINEGKHYMIHASATTMRVTYEELKETTSYLYKIDRMIQVK